jgi:hypothetical protein
VKKLSLGVSDMIRFFTTSLAFKEQSNGSNTYRLNSSVTRSGGTDTSSILLERISWLLGLLKNEDESRPDLRSSNDATASCDPIYCSAVMFDDDWYMLR